MQYPCQPGLKQVNKAQNLSCKFCITDHDHQNMTDLSWKKRLKTMVAISKTINVDGCFQAIGNNGWSVKTFGNKYEVWQICSFVYAFLFQLHT